MNLRNLYAQGMAEALNMTLHELYDWERAIRDDGQFSGGRSGPGGGTPATPGNVALLLSAILGSPTKRNAGRIAKTLNLGAMYISPNQQSRDAFGEQKCPLTGQSYFGEALTVLLALPQKARDIDRIEVDPDIKTFTIWESYSLDGKIYTPKHRFAFPDADEKEVPPIRTVRILTGKALRAIAEAMAADEEDNG
ncbi:hypothetical protein [Azospirillum griseum]|uniref:Uncharacterized protein n=1 Tax=Azospirillum griseum TaxID=2496639 RepID=A0A3S0I101_9PROT|nr:hypothetical protein [Azospirillum griseum]RTR24585.1 hypothetical protein EJ903_02185 [Azospirillum griseum]